MSLASIIFMHVLLDGNMLNSLTTVGYLLEVFSKLWIPSLFPLLLGANTGNLSQSFFDTFSVVHNPLISELSMVRTL